MYTKDSINKLYRDIAVSIDISDEMFENAEEVYKELGKWVDENTPLYDISIYPQGSFGLGTVVKPISNADDYDMDVVLQFAHQYGLTAKALKVDTVKPLLVRYKKASKEIEEKRRCWHVEYDDVPNFHMDVIPSYADGKIIEITDHNEDTNQYSYIGSNPSGYIQWFFGRCAKQRERLYENYKREHQLIVAQADVEEVKRRKVKTPLQRAVQLLKRHRDIVFEKDDSGNKPISILITTIAAQLYEEEDNIFDAIANILKKAPAWLQSQKSNGKYYIPNPACPLENYADKWNEHPERAQAFFTWLAQAQKDLSSDALFNLDRVGMGQHIRSIFGDLTGKIVFAEQAAQTQSAIKNGTLKVNPHTGSLSAAGSIAVAANHHHGK